MTRRTRLLTRATGLTAFLFAALFSSGCGDSSAKGTVSGNIKVNGKPLKSGLITFDSQVGKRDPYSAKIIDGYYQTTEIPVGATKISIPRNLSSF